MEEFLALDKLKLTISGNEDNVDVASSFTSSLDAVVKRKIQDLYVICLAKSYEMPPSIFNYRDRLRSFLPVISNIRDMTVSENTFKLFYQYSKFEPFPQFGNMSRLHVTLCVSNLIWLPNFLESCPNLKSLTMVCSGGYDKINEISFSSVPECFCYRLSSLLS
ncbi:putative F-box/FBD/LRR-repeat protein At5g25850 isoform X3 [Eutrema salsugineum]|uniref:putative F-box/FBD/LRR-repeat protein At5g25850 isoform X3 n=1 Tax=Eutrema salsugineum TaxID=72664 RepID=UPI000CED12FD|nr:putative F-box/FBD/LRR-repeat protein At5g25850 isoform X3 [Eutrema salsugineum]